MYTKKDFMKLTKTLLHTTDNYITSLEKSWVSTVMDLILNIPREYEDRTEVLESFSLINLKEKNTMLVTLVSVSSTRTANKKLLTKVIFEDKNGFLAEGVWFNRDYFAKQIKVYEGKKVLISGKVKYDYGKLSFSSPDVETDLSKVEGEIVPIYSDINYLPGHWIAGKMPLLKQYFSDVWEVLPEEIIKKYNFIPRKEAYFKLHFPKNQDDINEAKRRLAYEELYNINYSALSKKYESFAHTEGKSLAIPLDADIVKTFLEKLPFALTDAQKIALFQILKDMEKTHAMQRLLEWDVGTGKTVVALLSAIHAIKQSEKLKHKIQVAFMAPTEILARQHFEGMGNILFESGISLELLVGSTTAKNKQRIKEGLKSGNIDIIVGTHALIQEDVLFANLWLVVIDEQHRFWVKQREVLETGLGSRSGLVPHSLNMTATPIPRTLALTLYGDQDLSIIAEYPKGRKEIYTKVAKNDEERRQIELFVRSELEKWRQVFWISPLVEESEKIDLANAKKTYESLIDIFSPFAVWLLHGKMKAKEKEEVMRDFSENKLQILSSTSVVEVGVDVPNASIICIEGAERFWLSQLHQFRGRVGRGKYQSYCYLFPTSWQKTERLRAMERSNNGFELAEMDLDIRWPWEVYWLRQSGIPDLKVADLRDLALISQIREDIEVMFEKKSEKEKKE